MQMKHTLLNTFQELSTPIRNDKTLKKYYQEPLYHNSIAMMLNSAFSALFGLLFWIVAGYAMPAKDIRLATAAISAVDLDNNK
jgi:hypothetical protein